MTELQTHNRAGWQSPLATLVTTDSGLVVSVLQQRYPDSDEGQLAAWGKSIAILQQEGKAVIDDHPPAKDHGSILEYELPREGGRRPDIILLQDAAMLVIEFKNKTRVHLGDIDQVAADVTFFTNSKTATKSSVINSRPMMVLSAELMRNLSIGLDI